MRKRMSLAFRLPVRVSMRLSNPAKGASAFLAAVMLAAGVAEAQQSSFTWSSKSCDVCESTIVQWHPGWSGVFTEGTNGKVAYASAAVAVVEGNLVVAAAIVNKRSGTLTFNPRKAVTLEADSGAHMVLFSIDRPDTRIPKDFVGVKKQFKDKSFTLKTDAITAGYLFFPRDDNASRVTVVIHVGNETFRFPFARNPNAFATFVDPDRVPVASTSPASADVHLMQEGKQIGVTPVPVVSSTQPTMLDPPVAITARTAQGACKKEITFAVAENGGLAYRLPKVSIDWLEKTEKKVSGVCFSQLGNRSSSGDRHYLVVLSYSRGAFNGLLPVFRTGTSTNTTPVSGSGTVTDNYGSTWNYTYRGSVTTTTTATTQTNVPYTDTTTDLYANAYNEAGALSGCADKSATFRQGGDAANTLGYNLGSLLMSRNLIEHLLEDIVKQVGAADSVVLGLRVEEAPSGLLIREGARKV